MMESQGSWQNSTNNALDNQCKRRRVQEQSTQNCTGMTELEQRLNRLALETEDVMMRRPDHPELPPVIRSIPTYRGALAKRGYLVDRTLGSGSYSKVKLALNVRGNPNANERVAVKIIDRSKAPLDFQQRFLPRELKYWPLLNHPNLVKFNEVFTDSRRLYIIQELMDKGNALQYIQLHRKLPETLARKWLYQVVDAVRYMHNRDITHRDLKLENMLLDADLNIKVCDFGFVKPHSSRGFSETYCGSKAYACPGILHGRPYDPRKADVWAIGVILYILVTGRMPYDESKGTKHIIKEQQKGMSFCGSMFHNLSVDCKDLLHRTFTLDPNIRPHIHDLINHSWFHGRCMESHLKTGSDVRSVHPEAVSRDRPSPGVPRSG